MNKTQTVIKTVANIADIKRKKVNKDTVIDLFTKSNPGFNEDTNTFRLGHTDSTTFLREIEDKYGIFFPGPEYDAMTSVASTVEVIKTKLDNIKQARKKDKTAIQDFRFSRHGVEVINVKNDGESLGVMGNDLVALDGDFWGGFDKWYSDNRKKLSNKYKPVKAKKQKKDKMPAIAKAA
jgi:hypothetical protein